MTTTNTPLWMTDDGLRSYPKSINGLKGLRNAAQTIIADLNDKVEAKDEENTEYAFELQKYEGIVVTLQSENATLRKEVERLKGVVHRLNIDSILKRGEQLELTPFDFDELKAEITRLKEDLEGWHELASKKDAELTVALLQSDTLKAEVERLKGEFREK